ncbi:HNH endonuclease family protein [Paenibacillus chitinolyticus]|uniref:HNH endonuclease family protein n=1 Tax=Paenibacillus chitinolyticus TaxID=79263 RepID=UPI00295EF671|nr:HNH endonuclease family protein [Paenibacillus chitinolyticus]
MRDHRRHSTQLLGISKHSLEEHMMPKKWRNHWAFNGDKAAADFRDLKLLTLGNLTIITQALNASIRDSDWATKKYSRGDKGGLGKCAEGNGTLSLISPPMFGTKRQF